MRSRYLAFPLIMALTSIGGCTTLDAIAAVASPTGSVASVAPAAMNTAKKALTTSHALHEAAADALTIAAQSGVCHGVCAGTAKTYLNQSEAYLVAADKLVALGDAPGIQAKIGAANSLVAQVETLIGSK